MSENIKTLITLDISDELIEQLRSVSPRYEIEQQPARQSEEISDETWAGIEVLYTLRVLPTPEQAPNLRWIQFQSAGVNHALEHDIMRKSGLIATTLSGANAPQVAEHVVTMLLALGRNLPEMQALQSRAEWPPDRWDLFMPKELTGSTVGLVGYGSIGRQVAHLLNGFGVTVLAAKHNAMQPADNGYTPEGMGDPSGDLAHRIYPIQALRSMLAECDFVVISTPLTEETRGLIGEKVLAAMKPDAFLVDISRGGVVDIDALLQALKQQRIGGAALDVFPQEPLPADSPLWELPNVIISPHIAGVSSHYDERAVALVKENMQRYAAGKKLFNQVDLQRGY